MTYLGMLRAKADFVLEGELDTATHAAARQPAEARRTARRGYDLAGVALASSGNAGAALYMS